MDGAGADEIVAAGDEPHDRAASPEPPEPTQAANDNDSDDQGAADRARDAPPEPAPVGTPPSPSSSSSPVSSPATGGVALDAAGSHEAARTAPISASSSASSSSSSLSSAAAAAGSSSSSSSSSSSAAFRSSSSSASPASLCGSVLARDPFWRAAAAVSSSVSSEAFARRDRWLPSTAGDGDLVVAGCGGSIRVWHGGAIACDLPAFGARSVGRSSAEDNDWGDATRRFGARDFGSAVAADAECELVASGYNDASSSVGRVCFWRRATADGSRWTREHVAEGPNYMGHRLAMSASGRLVLAFGFDDGLENTVVTALSLCSAGSLDTTRLKWRATHAFAVKGYVDRCFLDDAGGDGKGEDSCVIVCGPPTFDMLFLSKRAGEWAVRQTVDLSGASVSQIDASPDLSTVLVADNTSRLVYPFRFDRRTGQYGLDESAAIDLGAFCADISVDPDGRHALLLRDQSDGHYVFDLVSQADDRPGLFLAAKVTSMSEARSCRLTAGGSVAHFGLPSSNRAEARHGEGNGEIPEGEAVACDLRSGHVLRAIRSGPAAVTSLGPAMDWFVHPDSGRAELLVAAELDGGESAVARFTATSASAHDWAPNSDRTIDGSFLRGWATVARVRLAPGGLAVALADGAGRLLVCRRRSLVRRWTVCRSWSGGCLASFALSDAVLVFVHEQRVTEMELESGACEVLLDCSGFDSAVRHVAHCAEFGLAVLVDDLLVILGSDANVPSRAVELDARSVEWAEGSGHLCAVLASGDVLVFAAQDAQNTPTAVRRGRESDDPASMAVLSDDGSLLTVGGRAGFRQYRLDHNRRAATEVQTIAVPWFVKQERDAEEDGGGPQCLFDRRGALRLLAPARGPVLAVA